MPGILMNNEALENIKEDIELVLEVTEEQARVP